MNEMQICCELCGIKLAGEKCIFATVTRNIEGREYTFCCAKHADRYEAGLKAGEGAAKKSVKKRTKKSKSGKSKLKKSKKGGRR